MSFISVLKRIGLLVLKGEQIFIAGAPLVSEVVKPYNPTVSGKIDSLDQMIHQAYDIEQNFVAAFGPDQKTGPAKLQALIAKMPQIVQQVESLSGHKVADEALFTKAMQEYSQATADLLNSLDGSAQTNNPVSVPAPALVPQPIPSGPGSGVPVAVGPEPAKGGA